MKKRAFNYIRFWFHAKHLHGIHSPFLYKLLDDSFNLMNKNLIYIDFVTHNITQSGTGSFLSHKKRIRFLSALIQVLDPERLKVSKDTIITNSNPLLSETKHMESVTDLHNMRHKIYWINCTAVTSQLIDGVQKQILDFAATESNDAAVIIMAGIRCNDELFQLWRTITSNTIVKISLDCYDDGVLFFKEGVAKQDFAIKI